MMATDVEGVSLTLLFEEVVEEDAAASLRELNPRFEDEGMMTDSGVEMMSSSVEMTSSGIEMMGSDPGVYVSSCMPQ